MFLTTTSPYWVNKLLFVVTVEWQRFLSKRNIVEVLPNQKFNKILMQTLMIMLRHLCLTCHTVLTKETLQCLWRELSYCSQVLNVLTLLPLVGFSQFSNYMYIFFVLIVILVEQLTFSVVIFTTQMRNLSAAFVISKLVTAQFFIPILLLNHLIQPVMHFIWAFHTQLITIILYDYRSMN